MLVELETVRQWLRTNGAGPADTGVDAAHAAAEAYVAARCRIPAGDTPGDLALAVCLLTARYLARRNSPEGLVAFGEMGPGRLPANDYDVRALIAPWRKAVV